MNFYILTLYFLIQLIYSFEIEPKEDVSGSSSSMLMNTSKTTPEAHVARCERAVSIRRPMRNSDCINKCAVGEVTSQEFIQNCAFITVTADQTVNATGCYTGVIFGYVLNSFNPLTVGYRSFRNIPSPQRCQDQCQQDQPTCHHWIWQPPEMAAATGHQSLNCYLKNQRHVERAWLGSSPDNEQYCNITTTNDCNTNPDLRCMGTRTCIWCSRVWLSSEPWCPPQYVTQRPLSPEGNKCWWDGEYADHNVPTTPSPNVSTTVAPSIRPTENPSQPDTKPQYPIEENVKDEGSYSGVAIGAATGVVALAAAGAAGYYMYAPVSRAPEIDSAFENEVEADEITDRDQGTAIGEENYM